MKRRIMKWTMVVFVIGVLVSVTQTIVFCADIIVDSTTKVNLPAVGTAGRLYRVTDDVRGLWMDQGSQWFSLSGEIVNVKEFGAKADGITNDSAAIQAAVNTGRPVWIPGGTYKVNAEITLSNANQIVLMAHDAVIDISSIAGTGTAGVHDAVNVLAAFKVTGTNVTIRGGRITGTGSSDGKNLVGILVHGASLTKIIDTRIDSLYTAIWPGNGTTDLRVESVELSSCSHNFLVGHTVATSPQVNRAILSNIISHNSNSDGIKLNTYAQDIEIIGGHFYNNTRDGIDMFVGGERISIIGAHCFNNAEYGIDAKYTSGTGTGAGQFGFNRRFIVEGCYFRNNTIVGISVIASRDIFSTNVEEVIIKGNIAEGNGSIGFLLGLSHGVVMGNVSRGNTGKGFQLQSCNDVVIIGNQAWDNGTTVSNQPGFGFALADGTPPPPASVRITMLGNQAGDTQSGTSRTQNYGYDLNTTIGTSLIAFNTGTNHITYDFNVGAISGMQFFGNIGTGIPVNQEVRINDGQISFAGDTAIFRDGVNGVKTSGDLRATYEIVARAGGGEDTRIGAVGPAYEPGVRFGSAGDTNLYRSAANTLVTDDNFVSAGTIAPQNTTAKIYSGSGTPEGVVTANVGSIYLRTDTAIKHLYVKESGTGNTGWTAK